MTCKPKFLNRRQLLNQLTVAGCSSTLLGFDPHRFLTSPQAYATDKAKTSSKFLILIHAGSYDGIGLGLIQGLGMTGSKDKYGNRLIQYQNGLFDKGTPNPLGPSANPYLNTGTQVGPLVLHEYVRCLTPIAKHLAVCVGNRHSIDHGVAASITQMGAQMGKGNPNFTVGFSQALTNHGYDPSFVLGNSSLAYQLTSGIKDVGYVDATTIGQFKDGVSDNTKLSGQQIPLDQPISQIFTKHTAEYSSNYIQNHYRNGLAVANAHSAYLKSISKGLNGIEGFTTAQKELEAALTKQRLLDLMSHLPATEAEEVYKSRVGFLSQMQLAGAMAASKFANGMTIFLNGGDQHSGGAEVDAGRLGGNIMGTLRLFWDWVVSRNLENEVMVAVSHDFSRSPYNSLRSNNETIRKVYLPDGGKGTETVVNCPGRDHNITFGLAILHGQAGANGTGIRLGNTGDGYNPFPTSDLKGSLNYNGDGYRTEDLMCSMLMRCYPDLFPDFRLTKRVWRSFEKPIDLILG